MTTAAPGTLSEITVLRHQAEITRQVLRINVAGLTHQDSLVQPSPGGNCLNWVVGHLVWAYEGVLPLLGQQSVLEEGALNRYARGAPPLTDPSEAIDLQKLLEVWDAAAERVDAGLSGVAPELLDQPAPDSPTDDPNETVRTLLSTMLFHQAYHAGQTGILRRVAGKPGAIA